MLVEELKSSDVLVKSRITEDLERVVGYYADPDQGVTIHHP